MMVSAHRARLAFDYAIYDDLGQLSVVVEAKGRLGISTSWAREWHQAAMSHARRINARVLLVFPNRVYFWERGAQDDSDPTLELDARPWFQPYFTRLKIEPKKVDPDVFKAIAGMWLQDVAHGGSVVNAGAEPLASIFDALRGGGVVDE